MLEEWSGAGEFLGFRLEANGVVGIGRIAGPIVESVFSILLFV